MRFLLIFFVISSVFADDFSDSVSPVLTEHCSACHNPENARNKVDFLKASSAADVSANRGLWRNVATQLRNRTMPPGDSQLSEQDRFRVATWINERLRETACELGEVAGDVGIRRLTRRDYHNTILDLFGIDLEVEEIFPADGSGGEGFDTNGDTLFVPPMMMERYLTAADRLLEQAAITPPYQGAFEAHRMTPPRPAPVDQPRLVAAAEPISADFTLYAETDYDFQITVDRARERPIEFVVEIDGEESKRFTLEVEDNASATGRGFKAHLAAGAHRIAVRPLEGSPALPIFRIDVSQERVEPTADARARHYRLLGLEPGQTPLQPRKAARDLVARLLPQAFRRPVDEAEVDRFMKLYDRADERGDPWENSVKLALKGVLVSPSFLFLVEQAPSEPGLKPLTDHELAARLSYFLWSTTPDEELRQLAAQGRLQDPATLARQVDRLLDHPRSRTFARAFIGQWLGTKDVGGRVAPTVNEVQHFYTPQVAADMREEPVLLFHRILGEDRDLLEIIDSDYTLLTSRLARFYQVDDQVDVRGEGFQLVNWGDDRRGGVLGAGAVLAMTSHFKQNSPVLRGAWVLETLLGTPVPSPPPDVPPLDAAAKSERGLTIRQKLVKHREDPACSACHDLIDPIGFGLENFDWLGRWRDTAENDKPVDAAGVMPSGESFSGPAELRRVLLSKQEEFLRLLSGKMLGYALGRPLNDADQCVVQRLVDTLKADGNKARTLVREIVLSTPFRYKQGPDTDMRAANRTP